MNSKPVEALPEIEESNAAEPPAWHDQALAEDAARYAADPSRGDSWANVKRRITGQAS